MKPAALGEIRIRARLQACLSIAPRSARFSRFECIPSSQRLRPLPFPPFGASPKRCP